MRFNLNDYMEISQDEYFDLKGEYPVALIIIHPDYFKTEYVYLKRKTK